MLFKNQKNSAFSALSYKEIMDLQWQIYLDQKTGEENSSSIQERDRLIGLHWLKKTQAQSQHNLAPSASHKLSSSERNSLFRFWLESLSLKYPSLSSRHFRYYQVAERLLILLGLLTGYTTMSVLVYYDGSRPVNAFYFLAFFVGLQLILSGLAALSLGYLLSMSDTHVRETGIFQTLIGGLLEKFASWQQRIHPEGSRAGIGLKEEVQFLALHLPKLRSLIIFRSIQYFSIAFHLAALVNFLLLVVFSDLAFSWGSTLPVSAQSLKGFLDILAAPWSWMQAEWVPSLDVLEKTQYFRIEKRYITAENALRASDPQILGEWWRFLAMCLVSYALIPRIILCAVAQGILQRYGKSFDLESIDHKELLRRLTQAQITWNSSESEESLTKPARIAPQHVSEIERCHVILWRDLPVSKEAVESYYQQQFSIKTEKVFTLDGSQRRFQGLVEQIIKKADPTIAVLIVIEDFEEPGKAIAKLIKNLRAELGEQCKIQLHLVSIYSQQIQEADSDRYHLWRKFVHQIQDSNLGILVGDQL